MRVCLFEERKRKKGRKTSERVFILIYKYFSYRMTVGEVKNPVYQPEVIQLDDRQNSAALPGTGTHGTDNYNEINEPTVKYLFLSIIITSSTFSNHLHICM